MRLYVANCLRQRQLINYRLDFDTQGNMLPPEKVRAVKQQPIGRGQQVTMGGDMHLSQVQSIMDQLKPTGAIGVEELGRIPNKQVSVLMSVDKVIPKRAIEQVMSHNNIFLMRLGEKRRKMAAIGTSAAVDAAVKSQAELRRFDVEVEQLDGETETSVAEGFHTIPVDGQGEQAPRRAKGRRR